MTNGFPDSGCEELYDLAADPGEVHNLAEERPGDRQRLAQDLNAWVEGVESEALHGTPASGFTLDSETRRALRSLGYIQ